MVAMGWMGVIGGMVVGHVHVCVCGGGGLGAYRYGHTCMWQICMGMGGIWLHGLRGLRWPYAQVQCVGTTHVQASFYYIIFWCIIHVTKNQDMDNLWTSKKSHLCFGFLNYTCVSMPNKVNYFD